MAHIEQLSPHIADLIAAGEVVERPASVMKELLENAIDAGATQIVAEIRNGGMTYLRVADNGCGIARSEVPVAFLRHATSKLRRAEDLSAIGTLGFRGEALAAISAVSRLDIFTRQPGAEAGTRLSLEGGVPQGAPEPAGCPEGTTMVVRDLFFNTPARMKFMKKDSAEASAVTAVVQHLSLSNPHISFRFLKDGAEVLHTPGDNKLSSAIYATLGREFALGLQEVKGQGDGVEVSGYVTKPINGRGTRGMQIFFVNGRLVKSQMLTAALEEAYKNQLLKGKFPGCVLHITLPKNQVDVNVHPAKTVVKFAQERPVFSAVYHVVQDALDAAGRPQQPAPAAAASAPVRTGTAVPRRDFYQTMDAKTFRERQEKKAEPAAPAFLTRVPPVTVEMGRKAAVSDVARPVAPVITPPVREVRPAPAPAARETVFSKPSTAVQRAVEKVEVPAPAEEPKPLPAETPAPSAPAQTALFSQAEEEPEQVTMTPAPAPHWRMAGEVLRTYILAEDGENLWLIDKHAAHERINFDRLKANTEPIMGQALLAAEAVKLAPEDAAVLLEHLPLLAEFGFEAEEFGGDSLLVRAIPSDIDAPQIQETLEELAQKLRTCGTADPSAARDAMLHTMACKAAIKGGWVSDPAELQRLVDKVASGEVRYCPHGRPVAVKLTRYELEKMFKRA